MTSITNVKGRQLFNAEHLRNGTRQRHGYNGMLIVTYTCPVP